MRLEGKVAVVTGGGAGIGEGIVMCMARNITGQALNVDGGSVMH
jgi:NADP-dependent 3-hydroxy acid dehydrogenase YdfG